jgi:hypothetical protein
VTRLGFALSYQIPSDGDAASAASVNVAFEAAGDRTALLAADIGVYSSLGHVSNGADGTLPWSSWASHTMASTDTWESAVASPLLTITDFLNSGDVVDIEFSGTCAWSGTNGVNLALFYELCPSAASPSATPTKLPGASCGTATVTIGGGNPSAATFQAFMRGRLVVPGASLNTLMVYLYASTHNGTPANVSFNMVGDYLATARMYRPTQFRSAWP